MILGFLPTEISKRIQDDFKSFDEYYLDTFFENFKKDNRTLSFLRYYNRTVLDKERIDFGEFKHQWAIQGMTKEEICYFNENFDSIKHEIIGEQNIEKFFYQHCCRRRKEGSFCSKLFHTFLPQEFPPLDNPIRKYFGPQTFEFVNCILVVKQGYKNFIQENPEKIILIRKLLSKPNFDYIRVNELTDIRILDMYYWFKKNRENRTNQNT